MLGYRRSPTFRRARVNDICPIPSLRSPAPSFRLFNPCIAASHCTFPSLPHFPLEQPSSTSPMTYHFELVTPSNAETTLPQTLELIKALATYEKAPDAVEATLPLLRRSLFGEEGPDDKGKGGKYAECVLAYEKPGGQALGMAVWFYTFSVGRRSPMILFCFEGMSWGI